jgi:hypothetical protein
MKRGDYMTKEEAKQVIQQLLEENADLGDWTNHKDECQKIADALDLAFKSLEQEPSEDCVSRKSIEKLKRWRFSYDNNTTIPKSDLFVKLTDLRGLPSVAPIKKKGRWEFIGYGCYACSECGEVYTVRQFEAINNYRDNRFPKGCPNCATEMEN